MFPPAVTRPKLLQMTPRRKPQGRMGIGSEVSFGKERLCVNVLLTELSVLLSEPGIITSHYHCQLLYRERSPKKTGGRKSSSLRNTTDNELETASAAIGIRRLLSYTAPNNQSINPGATQDGTAPDRNFVSFAVVGVESCIVSGQTRQGLHTAAEPA